MKKPFLLPLLLFSFITFLFSSCQTLILGEPEANNPENNFEIFGDDFDRHYGLFTVRGWDWDNIYIVYRPQVTHQTTDEGLWEINRQIIEYLDDSHTFIYWPGKAFFRGNSEEDERLEAEFSLPLIVENHLEIIDSSSREEYVYGSLTGRNIGYLRLGSNELEDENFGDRLLRDLGHHDAIIIDLRNNTGDDDLVGADLAARFSRREELVYTVQERNGPKHTDFAGKTEYFLRKESPVQFTKPVVVLTDHITVNAAEVMLIYLKALPHVTQIGTATSGDFSDTGMRRFLPNGWQYQYSIMKFLLPDGVTDLDGTGHVPDVEIRNSADDILAGNDPVLERAYIYLFEEFGIR